MHFFLFLFLQTDVAPHCWAQSADVRLEKLHTMFDSRSVKEREKVSDRSALGEWTSRVGGNSHDWQVGSTSEVARSCTQVFLGVGTLARWRGVLRSECAEGWSAAFLLGEILGSFFKSKSTIAQNTLSPGTDIRIILCCFTTELRQSIYARWCHF